MTRSNRPSGLKSCREVFRMVILSCHGLVAAFSRACCEEGPSISMAVILASDRWASIMARSPVPVPTSSAVRTSVTSAQAPSSTPSVPTLKTDRSCRILNCLNWNQGFAMSDLFMNAHTKQGKVVFDRIRGI